MAAVTHAPAFAHPCAETPSIMDIEASGFGRSSYPIEVGYVLGDGSSFCTLIRPLPSWTHWDASAESVHHISRPLLDRNGRTVTEVAALLNERLRGRTLYSDGWGHDFSWLSTLFEEAGCVPLFRLESLRKLLSEDEANRWQRTRDRIKGEFSLARHRASVDAWLLQQTWLRVREEASD